MLYGELQDPHKEFFVVLNPATSVRNIWRETYVLQHHMLPAYFSHSLAQKILLIGKSINFIRLCLQKMPRVTAKDEEIDAKRNGTLFVLLRFLLSFVLVGMTLLLGDAHVCTLSTVNILTPNF